MKPLLSHYKILHYVWAPNEMISTQVIRLGWAVWNTHIYGHTLRFIFGWCEKSTTEMVYEDGEKGEDLYLHKLCDFCNQVTAILHYLDYKMSLPRMWRFGAKLCESRPGKVR